jgi:hypothetical protein
MNRLRTRLRASIASGPLVLLDFISGGLDPRITFSRGSNATLVDSTGKITYAPANLLLQSQTFDNASWSKTAVTVTANTAVAPDGTSTADAIIATAAAAIHSASQDSTLDGNIPVTFSVYVKAAGYTTGALRFEALSAPFNSLRLAFDLSAGTVTPVAYLGAVVLGSSISNVGNGWFRVSITGTTGFSGAHRSYVFPSTGASFTGDGTSGIFIWGAQLEPVTYQTTPSTYVATTTAAYYGPRFDYDPVTLAAKGLLIEEQRTNLALYSEQFDNAAWTKGDTAVTANATTAPSGATTADLLTETATTNFHFVLQAVTTAAGAATATVYAKLASGSRNLVVYPQGTTVGYAIFNLSTGAITASGGGALLSSSITPAGNGWYRCSVSWTASAASTNFVCYLTNSTTNPAPNYAGDGTSGIFLWGAQLELGSTATTYTRNNGGRFPARFDYDPATLAPKGILIEEQRVNRTLQSEDFTVSPWAATVVGTSTRVNDNSALGFMRGLVTATSANGGIRQTFASLTSGQVYALSFYIQSTTTAVSVFMENGTASFGAPHNVTINPSNGTAGALTGFTSVTITPFSSGYIYTLITAPAGGTLSANFEWRIVANGGSMLYGRPQFEAGAFATSYIPTVASQVTRTADQCAIVAPNFAPWYNAREGSLVVSGDWYGISGNDYWAAIDDASVNNGVGLRADPFGGNYGLVRSGGADQASMYLDQLTANTVYNMAVAYKVNDFAACRNGGTVQTDGLGSVPVAPTRLSIGDGFTASGNILNGHIRSIRYYPVRLTNTQLQALTT